MILKYSKDDWINDQLISSFFLNVLILSLESTRTHLVVWFVFLTDETVLPFLSGTVFRYCLTSIVGQFAKANAAFQNFKTIDTTLQARVSVFFLRNKMRNKAPRKKLCTSERVDIPPLHYMIVEDSRCFQGCFFLQRLPED